MAYLILDSHLGEGGVENAQAICKLFAFLPAGRVLLDPKNSLPVGKH
jgi:hypothetical protein